MRWILNKNARISWKKYQFYTLNQVTLIIRNHNFIAVSKLLKLCTHKSKIFLSYTHYIYMYFFISLKQNFSISALLVFGVR